MNTQNISSNNFKGTFVFQPKNEMIRTGIKNITNKGKQIFYDIRHEGDMVLVTRDKYDKKVAKFIEDNNLAFAYYPEISTSSGLDDEIPSGLKKLMRIKNNCVIRNLDSLKNFLSENSVHLSKQSEYLKEAINTLRLNVENLKIKVDTNNILTIRDEAKQRTIKSTGFRNGISYIYVLPDSTSQDTRRVLIGKNGQQLIKEFVTPNEMAAFNRTFSTKIK